MAAYKLKGKKLKIFGQHTSPAQRKRSGSLLEAASAGVGQYNGRLWPPASKLFLAGDLQRCGSWD